MYIILKRIALEYLIYQRLAVQPLNDTASIIILPALTQLK